MRHRRVQQRDMQHVIFVQDFPGNTQCFRHEADGADAAALAVAAVVHLYRRLEDIFTGDRD